MAAVLRLKRRLNEDPAEALILSSKRIKSSEPKVTKTFKFAGTVKEQSDSAKQIQEAIAKDKGQKKNDSFKEQVCEALPDEKDNKEKTKTNLRILRKRKALKPSDQPGIEEVSERKAAKLWFYISSEDGNATDENQCGGLYTLYEMVNEHSEEEKTCKKIQDKVQETILCNNVSLIRKVSEVQSLEEQFVYDLYYGTNVDDEFIKNVTDISRCDLDERFVSREVDDESENYEEEDDSNDEDNWRNDYPEEDSDVENEYDYFGNKRQNIDDEMAEKLYSCDIIGSDEDKNDYFEPAGSPIWFTCRNTICDDDDDDPDSSNEENN
ncbi:probable RNA polymerase II nuclear localization protein SLC7A6OS [Limulus polyphemus]|uniref:Probable RNA polymerase II nuclear localization protein SLC7A6OS n=1 Tax=Limulus polyphemus TaxID=6850 RepID=A0ABM1BZQ9_LIMPO|nr:probable RNA polymerase II nuclear localization protein SLC7A6OS [Limulus polyphemus]